MEELKLLIEMVKDLPEMVLWVILMFFIYKLVVIGSIYGVIRFVTAKVHDWLVTKKTREVEYKEIRPMIDGMCVKSSVDSVIAQLHRIRNKGYDNGSNYIHPSDVEWLRKAIDEKIEKDAKKEQE